jgi:hypothetical protein
MVAYNKGGPNIKKLRNVKKTKINIKSIVDWSTKATSSRVFFLKIHAILIKFLGKISTTITR